jgi:hypothetical protein
MDEPGKMYVNGQIDHITSYLIFLINSPTFRLLSVPQKKFRFNSGEWNLTLETTAEVRYEACKTVLLKKRKSP